jgi:hypothetical protein
MTINVTIVFELPPMYTPFEHPRNTLTIKTTKVRKEVSSECQEVSLLRSLLDFLKMSNLH